MKFNQLVPQCNGFIARWVLLKITFLKCVLIQVIKDCMLEAATASVFDGGQCQSAINYKFFGALSYGQCVIQIRRAKIAKENTRP